MAFFPPFYFILPRKTGRKETHKVEMTKIFKTNRNTAREYRKWIL